MEGVRLLDAHTPARTVEKEHRQTTLDTITALNKRSRRLGPNPFDGCIQ